MKQNEPGINSVKPLAVFLQNQSAAKSSTSIIVYDQLLPSLNFYTAKNVITLYNGNPKARREIQFEDSLRKQKTGYVDLTILKDRNAVLNAAAQTPGFLITKAGHDLPDSLLYLRAHLKKHIVMDKWRVYY